jgi:hypothetical protein
MAREPGINFDCRILRMSYARVALASFGALVTYFIYTPAAASQRLFCVCTFVIHNCVNLNIGVTLTIYQLLPTSFSGSSWARPSALSINHPELQHSTAGKTERRAEYHRLRSRALLT